METIFFQKNRDKTHLIFNCYDFFYDTISKFYDSNSQVLFDKLLDKVCIVHINALNYLNAFRLFETLNDRGLELSAADLIKNYFLMKVSYDESIFNKTIDRRICQQSTSRLDDIYTKTCDTLNDKTEKTEILKIIKDTYDEAIRPISDDYFYSSFAKGYFRASETRTKYILWRLTRPTGETKLNVSQIQTEHIMPVTLSDGWIQYLKQPTRNS